MQTQTARITIEVTYVEGFEQEDAMNHAMGLAESFATTTTMSRRVEVATWNTEAVK